MALGVSAAAAKLAKEKGKSKVAPHVLKRIEKHNAELAIRSEDLIDVNEKKPVTQKGPGAWKRWLPEALARVCWGMPKQKRKPLKARCTRLRRRGKGKLIVKTTAPSVASTRCFARFYKANHSYVQSIRNAIGQRYMEIQY